MNYFAHHLTVYEFSKRTLPELHGLTIRKVQTLRDKLAHIRLQGSLHAVGPPRVQLGRLGAIHAAYVGTGKNNSSHLQVLDH